MLFIRRGARYVFIRSGQIDELTEYLVTHFKGKVRSFESGWTEVQEFQSLIFITPTGLDKTRVGDAEKIVMVPCESSRLCAEIFNTPARTLVEQIHLGPGTLIIRVAGNGEQLEQELGDTYTAESMKLDEAISAGEVDDTVILFTNTSLSKVISIHELIRMPLLVRQPSLILYRDLRKQGAHLITQSLKDKQWYEMRINIFDAAEHYEVHYERLQTVLSELDTGMILGEMWTRDHALALMSVLAYQVRLFTLEPPVKIKRVLMGLEYNRLGKRFVDMDLYYRNRKVGKNDKNVRKTRSESRIELRDDLYRQLSPETMEQLRRLEAPIETE